MASDTASQPESPPAQALPIEEVVRLFPQLEIIGLLGKGGMGAVYKARQPALDRCVALKILPRQSGESGLFAERFNREARALARLSHPSIVAVHDFGQTEGVPWFLMEFVDGVNLRQLERTRRLTPREALQLIPQICDALQYAHDQGVVHRDIKPENVLVDRRGRVKIADFGLARILGTDARDPRLTGEGQVMGTPHYMAPEQVEHPLEVDHRADIYALGVVFYELLTGELPLGRFPPPSRRVQVDVRLDDVVLRALEKEPARRYQQAGEVKTDVETISGSPARGGKTVPPASGSQAIPTGSSPQPHSGPAAEAPPPSGGLWGAEASQRVRYWEPRRQAALWYGLLVSVVGVPIGFAFDLPFVWGLGMLGVGIAGAKLGLWMRLRAQLTALKLGRPSVSCETDQGGKPSGDVGSSLREHGSTLSGRLDACPAVLWIALGALLLAFITKLAVGPRDNPWVLADLLLLLGLRLRLKAAWVAVLFFAVAGVFAALIWSASLVALGVLALNALVAVPVWLSAPWFFPGPLEDLPRRRKEALRGLLFLLPPMLFTSFLLGNLSDLDIDAQFYAAVVGLPVATGLGVALVWASTVFFPDDESAAKVPIGWSWRAIGSAVFLVLNLPLAGTALLMGRAVASEPNWNPSSAEAFFVLVILGGASLLALGSLVLGITARKECRNSNLPRRGSWLAWAGIWFWPALLVAAFLVQTHSVEGSISVTREEARVAEAVLTHEIADLREEGREIWLRWKLQRQPLDQAGSPKESISP